MIARTFKTRVLMGSALTALCVLTLTGVCHAEATPGAEAAPTPLRIVQPAPSAGTLDAQLAAISEAAARKPAERPASAPTVALAHALVDSAGAYALYMSHAAAIEAGFKGAGHVVSALKAGGGYAPAQFEAGATAYAAIVALQDPGFVTGVREWAATSPGEAPPVERLFSDPAQALGVPGAAGAASLASAALRAQGEAVLTTGKAVKQAAYSVQKQDWSKQRVPDAEARLAGLKAQSAVLLKPTEREVGAALAAAVAFHRDPAETAPTGVTPTIARALAVAAIAVLGGAGEENADRLQPLLTEPRTTDCVKMSKLNLYQCMAVAGPEYEDVFCLGQHALMDTGQCVIKAAGQPAPRPALPPTQIAQSSAAPSAPAAVQSVLVPVALTGAGH